MKMKKLSILGIVMAIVMSFMMIAPASASGSGVTITMEGGGKNYKALCLLNVTEYTHTETSCTSGDTCTVNSHYTYRYAVNGEVQSVLEQVLAATSEANLDGVEGISEGDIIAYLRSLNTEVALNPVINSIWTAALSDDTITFESAVDGVFANVTPGYWLLAPVNEEGEVINGAIIIAGTFIKDITVATKTGIATYNLSGVAAYTVGSSGRSSEVTTAVVMNTSSKAVGFKLVSTMPSNLSSYTKYPWECEIKLGEGLTSEGPAYIMGYGTINSSRYTLTKNSDSFKIHFDDVKSCVSSSRTISFEFSVKSSTEVGDRTRLLGKSVVTASVKCPDDVNSPSSLNNAVALNESVDVFVPVLKVRAIDSTAEGNPVISDAVFIFTKTNDSKENESDLVVLRDDTSWSFSNLMPGTHYYLYNTFTPDGYAKSPDGYYLFRAIYDESGEVTALNLYDCFTNYYDPSVIATAALDGEDAGIFNLDFEQSYDGARVLPTTGGIGTTIFKTFGDVVVVAGAAILLVVLVIRKKHENNSVDAK